MFTACEA